MSETAITQVILIGVANIRMGLKNGLGLHVDSFLHKFFKAIKLLAVLFHFGWNYRLQVFAEVANYYTFCKSPFRIKFE